MFGRITVIIINHMALQQWVNINPIAGKREQVSKLEHLPQNHSSQIEHITTFTNNSWEMNTICIHFLN